MENELSYKVIGAAIAVHQFLGGPAFWKVFMRVLYSMN